MLESTGLSISGFLGTFRRLINFYKAHGKFTPAVQMWKQTWSSKEICSNSHRKYESVWKKELVSPPSFFTLVNCQVVVVKDIQKHHREARTENKKKYPHKIYFNKTMEKCKLTNAIIFWQFIRICGNSTDKKPPRVWK